MFWVLWISDSKVIDLFEHVGLICVVLLWDIPKEMEKRKDSLFYSFFPHSCPKLHYVFLCNGFKSLCTLQFHKKKRNTKKCKMCTWTHSCAAFGKSFFLHLVCRCVWPTPNTSSFPNWLISPNEGVWRALLTRSCPVDHVVSRWAENTGRAGLNRRQSTAATLRGHASDGVGDDDGVDLCSICAVVPLLRE